MTSQETRRDALRERLHTTRLRTLQLLTAVPDDVLPLRVHDFYSPVGWHFGHVGRTEVFWTSEAALGQPCLNDALSLLFANVPENPKENRTHLPGRDGILSYLQTTRELSLDALRNAELTSDNTLLAGGYAWEFALRHECQHQETIAELMQLIQKSRLPHRPRTTRLPEMPCPDATKMIALPGGVFCMGSDDPYGYDNEKNSHSVSVSPFSLDETPVTNAQWLAFLADGGYERPELWTEAGWTWRESQQIDAPEYWYWSEERAYLCIGVHGLRELVAAEPVCGISWHEADAFARWSNKRLPTEMEWEYAAAFDPARNASRVYPWGNDAPHRNQAVCELETWHPEAVGSRTAGNSAFGLRDMAGGVWEWTASPFLPYPAYTAFPYDGYSKDYMDGQHFVCRGGSWATSAPNLRNAFRNWYIPTYRQGFLGLRCAQ